MVPALRRNRFGSRIGVLAILCALAFGGCSNGICCLSGRCCLPRIDPTGDHIFAHGNAAPPPALPVVVGPPIQPATPPIVTPPPIVAPVLPPAAAATVVPALPPDIGGAAGIPQQGVTLTPTQVIAAVGGEVLMIATVVNQNGSTLPGERVEWTIAQGGVGQFVSPGRRGALDVVDLLRGLPQKVNNNYVINSTVTFNTAIDRGTPTPTDDVPIRSGQAWVTVSSPIEGSTFVTAYAPNVKGWDQRQQTGVIYWIDSQWVFPPPAIAPVGSQYPLTTRLTRQTDHSPLAGWIVRYEIAGGPDAGFGPDGSPAIEVVSSETGEATAEVLQKAGTAGSNQINIQVIRPAGAGGPTRQVVVGSGSTSVTWTASDLTLRTTGPAQATVGAVATYHIEITNPAPTAIHGVVVTDQAPPGLSFLNSNPAPSNSPSGQEWQIGDLGPQQSQVIEVNFRVDQPGSLSYCASVSAASGQSAKGCATTTVAPGGPVSGGAAPIAGAPPIAGAGPVAGSGGQFDIAVKGPAAAEVGTDASFTIEVTNRGNTAATGVLVSDRFDAGFQHAAAASPIEANLDQIAPGETRRIAVTFHVTQPGQLCQQVTVTADGGLQGTSRSCITAASRAGALAPPASAPIIAAPPGGQGSAQGPPSNAGPTPANPSLNPIPANPPPANPPPPVTPRSTQGVGGSRLTVQMTGPDRSKLGDDVQFVTTVTNAGSVPLKNVVVSNVAETSLEVTGAEMGFVTRAGALVWTIDSIEPGQTKSFRVNCRCVKEATRACNSINVTADGGTTGGNEACLEIVAAAAAAAPAAPAVAASNMSVAVADNADPIRTGGETVYQIVLTNSGSGAAKQVALSVSVSAEMTITKIQSSPVGGTAFPRSMRFTPIAEVRPGESITFELRVRGDRAGKGTLHAEMTSDRDKTPIVADESTQILD